MPDVWRIIPYRRRPVLPSGSVTSGSPPNASVVTEEIHHGLDRRPIGTTEEASRGAPLFRAANAWLCQGPVLRPLQWTAAVPLPRRRAEGAGSPGPDHRRCAALLR